MMYWLSWFRKEVTHLKDTPPHELSTEQTAEILGVTEETVRNYRLSGELKSITRNRGKRKFYYFNRAEVEQFKAQLEGDVEG